MSGQLASESNAAPTRDALRQALATAIANHAEAAADLRENEASQERAGAAYSASFAAVERATEAIEDARIADAQAVAQGLCGSAVKAARIQLQNAEDSLEAARSAKTMLTNQYAQLDGGLGIRRSNLDRAVAAVVRESPETRKLVDEFRAAQRNLFRLREAMREIWRHYGALPDDAKTWEVINWDEGMAPSETATRVKDWISRLKLDADATLTGDKASA